MTPRCRWVRSSNPAEHGRDAQKLRNPFGGAVEINFDTLLHFFAGKIVYCVDQCARRRSRLQVGALWLSQRCLVESGGQAPARHHGRTT
jgi:hypothetical protein